MTSRISWRFAACVGAIALMLIPTSAGAQSQQPIVHTFQDLTLKPGQPVLIRTGDDKTFRGKLASITGDQLEAERRRWLFGTERRAFTQGTVERIKVEDSAWNGILIGAGAGVLGGALISEACGTMECLLPALLSISMGPAVGFGIDKMINRTVYTSNPSQTVGIAVVPLVASHRVGLMIHMDFNRPRRTNESERDRRR